MGNYGTMVHVEGRSIGDLFRLPCVRAITKNKYLKDKGPITVFLFNLKTAYIGDWICEDGEGEWNVLTEEEYNKLKQYGNT